MPRFLRSESKFRHRNTMQKPGVEIPIKQKLTFPNAPQNESGLRYISKAALVGNFIHCSPCRTCLGESRVIQSLRCVTLDAFTSRKLKSVRLLV